MIYLRKSATVEGNTHGGITLDFGRWVVLNTYGGRWKVMEDRAVVVENLQLKKALRFVSNRMIQSGEPHFIP